MNRTIPAALLLLAACGGEDDPSLDIGSNPGSDTGATADVVADVPPDLETDSGAADTAPEPDFVEGLPIPFAEHLGPCSRQVRVGAEQNLLFRYEYDYSESPDVVTALRYAGDEFDLAVEFFDVDTRRFCAKPPEERHGAFISIVGCPTRIIIDTGDNGLISPQDLAVSYTYDEFGDLTASDRFDWRNNFTGSSWFYEYNADGALLRGERIDGSAAAVSMVASYPQEGMMVLTIDDGVDGTTEERATFQFDANGNLLDQAVEEADPGTGELSLRSR
ncbi:MAG: hypothetical protein ACJAYU_003797, partial [Bradymonadia bacterium]